METLPSPPEQHKPLSLHPHHWITAPRFSETPSPGLQTLNLLKQESPSHSSPPFPHHSLTPSLSINKSLFQSPGLLCPWVTLREVFVLSLPHSAAYLRSEFRLGQRMTGRWIVHSILPRGWEMGLFLNPEKVKEYHVSELWGTTEPTIKLNLRWGHCREGSGAVGLSMD